MAVIRKCKICEEAFETKPFYIKKGQGKYCSSACHHLGLRKGRVVTCYICKKETYKSLKALQGSKSKKFFCSKSCQTTWRNSEFFGSKHANWVEGLYAYRSVLTRHKVPAICKRCKTTDKRVLAVHHIDQNRKNNTISNLTWLCHNCHHMIHRYPEERKKIHV